MKSKKILQYLREKVYLSIILTSLLQLVTLELSKDLFDNYDLIRHGLWFITTNPLYLLIALGAILLVDMILVSVVGIRAGMTVSSVLISILSIVNYFVNIWHGTPFTPILLKNTQTAMNVLSAYRIQITFRLVAVVIMCVLTVAASAVLFKNVRYSRKKSLCWTLAAAIVVTVGYLIPHSLVPRDVVYWSWRESMNRYGYLNCMIQQTLLSANSTIEPEGFEEEELESFVESYEVKNGGEQTPDIILILNETLFDLQKVTDLDADKDCLELIHNLDNSITGYTVVPGIGGGTNRTEYELLTSNLLRQAPLSTPFTCLNLAGANSAASWLNGIGYETMAAHIAPGLNYNRKYSYPAIGFQTAYFEEDFENKQLFADRMFYSDASAYENLIRWYNQMGENPRFIYLLTIQNHGGYDTMPQENFTVRADRDYGKLDHDVDEFLTCVSGSDQAFGMLTEYFSQVDRDVIICMLGDHGPKFVDKVIDREGRTEQQIEMDLRSTPYVIWSNHIDLTEVEVPEPLSVPYLMPSIAEMAEMPLSGYYDLLVNMRSQVPVISNYGIYMTADGTIQDYDEQNDYYDMLHRYLCLDYANIENYPLMTDFTAAQPMMK